MAAEKTLAIVLRVIDFSESSCVVTLFTEDFGKVSALAKGARRPKGPFEAALDLLAGCRIVFLRKSGDALDLLTEAKLERRFHAASRSLARLYAAYYVVELLLAWTEDRDSNRALFRLAQNTIGALDGNESVRRTVLHFEVRGLHLLGLLPSLQQCVECGAALDVTRRAAFGLVAGGVLCEVCKRGQRQVISLSSQARDTMQTLAMLHDLRADRAEGREVANHDLSDELRVWGELRGAMHHVIAHQLERRPRLYPYLTRYCQND